MKPYLYVFCFKKCLFLLKISPFHKADILNLGYKLSSLEKSIEKKICGFYSRPMKSWFLMQRLQSFLFVSWISLHPIRSNFKCKSKKMVKQQKIPMHASPSFKNNILPILFILSPISVFSIIVSSFFFLIGSRFL